MLINKAQTGFSLIRCISNVAFSAIALLGFFGSVSADTLWEDVDSESKYFKKITSHQQARSLLLDESKMMANIQDSENKQITLPLPNGEMIKVGIEAETILPKALADKYPTIKNYRVLPSKSVLSGRLDMGANGFHGMLQLRNGEVIFIDPQMEIEEETGLRFKTINQYSSYKKHQQIQSNEETYSCGAKHTPNELNLELSGRDMFEHGSQLKFKYNTQGSLINYRIAIAATGEYVAKHGGTVAGAMSAIVTTLSRVNQIYEKDLGVHLSLVENNDLLIYTNASSDPYTAEGSEQLIEQNQENIDRVIGTNNYDLGHLFTTSGGGLAAIGSVCLQSRKAKGISGISNPRNDSFNVDYVAHEIGHQLGATHTFNGTQGLCAGGTRTAITAYEPGSGSSVMSYAGTCGQDNLQNRSDAMFHIGSIEQIHRYIKAGTGRMCGTRLKKQNSPPLADAGKDFIIPAQTPFELKGSALDADGDALVYGWEQVDAGASSTLNEDTGNNPLFRAYMPTNNSSRTFPVIKSVLNHSLVRGESLPTQERTLHFKFVAQDGFNASQSDLMKVAVKRTGSRFALEQPRKHYVLGRPQTIKWNVAGTNKAPISCDNVDVLLSLDGGYSFPYSLLKNTPNTGEASVVLPTSLPKVYQARFKLKCSNNIFFAISYKNFRLILDDVADAPEVGSEKNLTDKPVYKKGATQNRTSSVAAGSANLFLMLLLGFACLRKISKPTSKW